MTTAAAAPLAYVRNTSGSAAGDYCCGARAGGGAGIFGQPSYDERCEEQERGLDRPGVVDRHSHRPTPPAFAVEPGELAAAVRQRVALAPTACRAQRKLAAAPTHRPSAPQPARLECADDA